PSFNFLSKFCVNHPSALINPAMRLTEYLGEEWWTGRDLLKILGKGDLLVKCVWRGKITQIY
ncbi:MAG: hypothetical protein ACXAC2_13000, partial [Candidatus Kariarchaeaceae archaeon]